MATTIDPRMDNFSTEDPGARAPLVLGGLDYNGVTETERNFSLAIHLSPLSGVMLGPLFFVAPLVLWLIRKDASAFNDDHGRETMNMLITAVIFSVALLFIPIIGWLALGAWYITAFISIIRGAVASSRGEYFRYPMTIRVL